EMMHVRNYQHSTGEQMLALELLLYGSTHDGRLVEPFTGFHEAAAEIWKTELYRQLFGAGTGDGATFYGAFKIERAPLTRTYLKGEKIRTLDDIEHFELGWVSVFNLLLCRKVDTLDMNGSGTFAEEKTGGGITVARKTTSFSLADLLSAFDP